MEAGRYLGNIIRSKVDATKNGCTQFVAVLRLTRFEGADLPAPFMPTAYLSLTKNNGERNTSQVDSLIAALGWDGVSLKKLHTTDWSQIEIEAVMDWDEFNGERKLKVRWINAPGSAPTLKATDPSVLDRLESYWAGEKPVPANVKSPDAEETIPDENIPF